jgi:hypothetical protein
MHIHGKQLQHKGQKEESTSSFLQHLIFPSAHALQSKDKHVIAMFIKKFADATTFSVIPVKTRAAFKPVVQFVNNQIYTVHFCMLLQNLVQLLLVVLVDRLLQSLSLHRKTITF